MQIGHLNSAVPPHFQSEARGKAFHMKTSFNSLPNKTHFHNKHFALDLALKRKQTATKKWATCEKKHEITLFVVI